MKKNCIIIFGIIIAAIISLFSGCSKLSDTPPSLDEVTSIFLNNREDFETITNYLIDLNINYIAIFDPKATLAGHGDITINNETAREAMERLVSKRILKKVFKNGNTIEFILWESFYDMGCGLAYTIDCRVKPNIQYLTELELINDDGWYYYVDDYNTWRVNNS